MLTMSRLLPCLALAFSAFGFTSCITQRTITEGGQTVDKKYVIKRPVKNVLENIEVE